MSILPIQEIQRQGVRALDEALKSGPVSVIKNNRAAYVVLRDEDYRQLMNDRAEARLAASERDLKSGRVRRGNAAKLMRELLHNE
ncbi:MAG: prevent-host-death protein [Candidatus Sumerlaeota bacterium]|nr:prevent-host-death protein [Candidatus Sumerlaeota bacterium]